MSSGARRAALVGAVLAGAVLSGACAAPAAPPAPADPLADVRSGPVNDPVDTCAAGAAHWAGVDLAGGFDVGDYQQRALSARQDDVRRTLIAEAGAATPTAEQLRSRARELCARLLEQDPGPTGF